jgi:hypothetical protein
MNLPYRPSKHQGRPKCGGEREKEERVVPGLNKEREGEGKGIEPVVLFVFGFSDLFFLKFEIYGLSEFGIAF